MIYTKKLLPVLCFVVMVNLACSMTGQQLHAAKPVISSRAGTYVMTSLELQSVLMSYADRCINNIAQMNYDFVNRAEDPELRLKVSGDLISFTLAAFTIAAQPNPEISLLDLMVLASLGRMIYEQHHLPKHGSLFDDIVKGFRNLEDDIWLIGKKLLTKTQRNELKGLIGEWRRDHPEQTAFTYMRFGEFAAKRQVQSLTVNDKASGMFQSVQEARDEAEKLRLLAERGIYLGTRVPFLTSGYASYSLSRLILNPDLQKILTDVHRFSSVAAQLGNEAGTISGKIAEQRDQLVDQVMVEMAKLRRETIEQVMAELTAFRDVTLNQAVEKVAIMRKDTIEHVMDRLSSERKDALADLLSEDERLKALLAAIRQTLAEGNNVLLSFSDLSDKFGTGTRPDDSSPTDIRDYKETLAVARETARELNTLVVSANALFASPGLETILSNLSAALNLVEAESKGVVDHTFRQAIIIVVIWLVGYVVARLLYQFLSRRLFRDTAIIK